MHPDLSPPLTDLKLLSTIDPVNDYVRVILVDDHPMVRLGIRAMLEGDSEIQVVDEAGNGARAIELVEIIKPDVALVDVILPVMDGFETAKLIKDRSPNTAVMMLTGYDRPDYVAQMLQAGATGYLVKGCAPELLRHAIHTVARGGTVIKSDAAMELLKPFTEKPAIPGEMAHESVALERFTPRELDVFRLLAAGRANPVISRELHLAEVTVKKHVQSIMGKVGVSDRTAAAVFGVRAGLLP